MNADNRLTELVSEYVEAASPRSIAAGNDSEGNNSSTSGPARASAPETAQRGNDTAPQIRPLFNGRDPQYVLQAERPVHRAITFLAAQGYSYVEIAQQLGMSPPAVGYIVKQEWAQKEILEQIHKHGGDAVAETLRANALPSVMKLVELRDSEESTAEVQRKSANDLLDRLYGKAPQPIVHSNEKLDELSDAELQEIVAKGRRN